MKQMFSRCASFQGIGLDTWKVNTVTNPSTLDISYMFLGCTNLGNGIDITINGQDGGDGIYWNFSSVTSTQNMFDGCVNLGNGASVTMDDWDLSNCTTTQYMFNVTFGYGLAEEEYTVSTQSMKNWKIGSSSATTTTCARMFTDNNGYNVAPHFNANVTGWDLHNVTNMSYMFGGCGSFQGIGLNTWYFSGTSTDINGTNCFYNSAITNEAYNGFLIALYTGFSSLTMNTATLTGTPAYYNANGASARYQLELNGWIITDAGFLPESEIEFPPSAMNANTTTISGHGTFVASASSVLRSDHETKLAFNYTLTDYAGWGPVASYDTNGNYTLSASIGGYQGEWIALQMPYSVSINAIKIAPRQNHTFRSPKSFVLVGSNDGSNWYLIYNSTNIPQSIYSNGEFSTFTFPLSSSYSHFALIVSEIFPHPSGASEQLCNILELRFCYIPSSTTPQFTSNNTVIIDGVTLTDEYIVSSISHTYINRAAYAAFDKNTDSTNFFHSMVHNMATNPIWIQIQYPQPVSLNNYTITPRNDRIDHQRAPEDFEIQGSNDNTNWTTLSTNTGELFSDSLPKTFTNVMDKTSRFYYLRLVSFKSTTNDNQLALRELDFNVSGL
jgi:hypothetical protein